MAVCALVGAADFNRDHFAAQWRAARFDAVFAVDGGLAALASIGCVPDVALGDFDSLGYVPADLPETVEVLTFPAHKAESDMELALRLACERGFDEAIVYGALGGRLDHTLANLQLLAAFSERGLRVRAVDVVRGEGAPASEHQDGRSAQLRGAGAAQTGCAEGGDGPCATALTFLTGPAELRLDPHPGATVSVFSLSDASFEVTEAGLAYPLDRVTLTNRTTWGLSNELTASPATVSVAAGTLVVFHPLYLSE